MIVPRNEQEVMEHKENWLCLVLCVSLMFNVNCDDIIRVAADNNAPLEAFLRVTFVGGLFAVVTDTIHLRDRPTIIHGFGLTVLFFISLAFLKTPRFMLEFHPLPTKIFRAVSLLSSLVTCIATAAIYLENFSRLLTEPLFHCMFAASLLMLALNIATILYTLVPLPRQAGKKIKDN
jgi:hypothetical protein